MIPKTRSDSGILLPSNSRMGDTMQMPTFFLVLMTVIPMLTMPIDPDCSVWPNQKGDGLLMACGSSEGLQLCLITSDGRRTAVDNVDAPDAVATGPVAWSPTDSYVAIEIGLDEEPGILLIDVSERPSAIFVDKVLVSANVSGAGPQWDSTGGWLVFRTSGTGDWENEGIYTRRIADGETFKLIDAVPRSMTISNGSLFLTRRVGTDPTKADLLIFRLPELLRDRMRIGKESMPRERAEKD